jgi:hypothetical protein
MMPSSSCFEHAAPACKQQTAPEAPDCGTDPRLQRGDETGNQSSGSPNTDRRATVRTRNSTDNVVTAATALHVATSRSRSPRGMIVATSQIHDRVPGVSEELANRKPVGSPSDYHGNGVID